MAKPGPKQTISRASVGGGDARQRFSVEKEPEVFFSNEDTSDSVRRAVEAGRARKVGPRLYTNNLAARDDEVVRRNAWAVVAGYFPRALVTDRTGLERRPASDGSVFVVHSRRGR